MAKQSKAEQIINSYSRTGREGTTDFATLSTKAKKEKIRVLLADATRKVEGTTSANAIAQSKSKGGGAKVVGVGRTQGLRTIQEVAQNAGFDQFIPALKFYDTYLKSPSNRFATATAEGWKAGKPQEVAIGTRRDEYGNETTSYRKFNSEDDYLNYLYKRLETFETAETSTNKAAINYYREQMNRGLRAIGAKEVKGKTLKTLFGYGSEKQGEWQKIGAEKQEALREYWATIRQAMKQASLEGYESDTVIDTYAEAQRIAEENSITPEEGEQIFFDTFNSPQLATVVDLAKRLEMATNAYGARTLQQIRDIETTEGDEETEHSTSGLGIGTIGTLDLLG